jgi:hypothetical protein
MISLDQRTIGDLFSQQLLQLPIKKIGVEKIGL